MDTNVTFSLENDISCLKFRVNGDFLTWQDWMSDSVNLLSCGNCYETLTFTLISFQTGAKLTTFTLAKEEVQKLLNSPEYLLTCANTGDSLFYEGLMLKKDFIEPTGNFLKGIEFQATGEIDTAIEHYNKVIMQHPNTPRIYNLLGLCYRIKGNYDKAEEAYKKAISISPNQAEAYCNLGILYLKKENKTEALKLFAKALECDQFYLNALMQYSKLLLQQPQTPPQLLSSVNLRLLSAYSDLPIVQEHLAEVAKSKSMPLHEYITKLKAENGFMANQKIMLLIKRTENLKINGAIFAALHGYQILLNKTDQTPAKAFIENWVATKLKQINKMIPANLKTIWKNKLNEVLAQYPSIVEILDSKDEKVKPASSPLTIEEFYAQVIFEMLRDGKIHPNQTAFLKQLKAALKLSDAKAAKIFNNVAKSMSNNAMQDSQDVAFNPARLFKNLVKAVFRDGKVEESERKILAFASKAFGLTKEKANKIIAEAKNE